jgi:hypothetical protein
VKLGLFYYAITIKNDILRLTLNKKLESEMQIKLRQVTAIVLAMLLQEVSGSESWSINIENFVKNEVDRYQKDTFHRDYFICSSTCYYRIKEENMMIVIIFGFLPGEEREKRPDRDPIFIDDYRLEEMKEIDRRMEDQLRKDPSSIALHLKEVTLIYTEKVADTVKKAFEEIPDFQMFSYVKKLAPEKIANIVLTKVGEECTSLTGMQRSPLKKTLTYYADNKLKELLNDEIEAQLYQKVVFNGLQCSVM